MNSSACADSLLLTEYIIVYDDVSTGEHFAFETLTLFPNPTTGDLTVLHPESLGNATIMKIYSATGQVVREGTLHLSAHSTTISLGELPDGLYWIQFLNSLEGEVVSLPVLLHRYV
jgi:hypothetical protein